MTVTRYRIVHAVLWTVSGILLAAGLVPFVAGEGVSWKMLAQAVMFFWLGAVVARRGRRTAASGESHE